jgi:hypothetical protein
MDPEKIREESHNPGNPYFWRIQTPLFQFPSTSVSNHTPGKTTTSAPGSLLLGNETAGPLIAPGSLPYQAVAEAPDGEDDVEGISMTEDSEDNDSTSENEDQDQNPALSQEPLIEPPAYQPTTALGLFVPEGTNEDEETGADVSPGEVFLDTESEQAELPTIDDSSDSDPSVGLTDISESALTPNKKLYYEVETAEKVGKVSLPRAFIAHLYHSMDDLRPHPPLSAPSSNKTLEKRTEFHTTNTPTRTKQTHPSKTPSPQLHQSPT